MEKPFPDGGVDRQDFPKQMIGLGQAPLWTSMLFNCYTLHRVAELARWVSGPVYRAI